MCRYNAINNWDYVGVCNAFDNGAGQAIALRVRPSGTSKTLNPKPAEKFRSVPPRRFDLTLYCLAMCRRQLNRSWSLPSLKLTRILTSQCLIPNQHLPAWLLRFKNWAPW